MSEVVTVLRVSSEASIQDLKKFEDAIGRAANVSAKFVTELTDSPRSIASISKGFEKLQSAGDPIFAAQVRRQKEVEKAFQSAGLAVANGIATQEQAATAVKALADRYDAQVAAAQKAAFAQTTLGKAVTGVSGQLIALSAGAGPVGTFLSALGPWGVAAAVGLGAAEAAFNAALESAHRLGDEANNLNKFAEATGLTTTQIQALTAETSKNGISAQDATGSITKFTVAWDELRKGQGDFLTRLRAVDAGLADQLQRTTNVTEAIDIYSAAVKKAEEQNDIAARNALLRAAGGRSGVINFGTIASAVNQAGGLDNLTNNFSAAHATLESGFLKDMDKLKNEIDETKKRADLLMASIGAESVLKAELGWQNFRLTIADTIKELDKSGSFLDKLAAFQRLGFGAPGAEQGSYDPFAGKKPVQSGPGYAGGTGDQPGYVYPQAVSSPQGQLTPQAEAARQGAIISALGSAATATERYRARVAQLDATWKQAGLTELEYQRALKGAATDRDTAAISAKVGALGVMEKGKSFERCERGASRSAPVRTSGNGLGELHQRRCDYRLGRQNASRAELAGMRERPRDGLRHSHLGARVVVAISNFR